MRGDVVDDFRDNRHTDSSATRALFVLPTYSSHADSIDAIALAARGLISALTKVFGVVDVLTPSGLCSQVPLPVDGEHDERNRQMAARLPRPLRVLLGDGRAALRAWHFRQIATALPMHPYQVVLQQHRRFEDGGQRIAARLGVPYVLRVDAVETSEEASWGNRRPGWRSIVESLGEARLFRKADLLLPLSTLVDEQLAAFGIPAHKREIVPSGVDHRLFTPGVTDAELQAAYGMYGHQRVGWIGGFRPFHGLELLPTFSDRLHAISPQAVVYLIGAGPLRDSVRAAVATRPWVRLVGVVPHHEIPRWLRCLDVAILPSSSTAFHYSPLKLYEYLACGVPVVAADVGDIGREVTNGREAILVAPGDPKTMAESVHHLLLDGELRQRLSAAAVERASDFSWDARAQVVVRAMKRNGLLPTTPRTSAPTETG